MYNVVQQLVKIMTCNPEHNKLTTVKIFTLYELTWRYPVHSY